MKMDVYASVRELGRPMLDEKALATAAASAAVGEAMHAARR